MSQKVTRCPKCGTSFRITSTQLQSARGAVRCGSCLHIFKAQDHLINSAPDNAQPQTGAARPQPAARKAPQKAPAPKTGAVKPQQATAARPRPEAAPKAPAGEKTQRPAASAPAAKAAAEAKAPQRPKPAAPPSQGDESPPPAEAAPRAKPDEPAPRYESPSPYSPLAKRDEKQKNLLDDDDLLISDDSVEPLSDIGDKPEDDDWGLLDDLAEPPVQSRSLFDREVEFTEQEHTDNADESWAEKLLAEDDDPVSQQVRAPETESSEHERLLREAAEPSLPQDFQDHPEPDDMDASVEPEHEPQHGQDEQPESFYGEPDTPESHLLIGNIDPEPVQLRWEKAKPLGRKILWPALAGLAALALVVQVAWLQFERLSVIEPYRSAYQLACAPLPCQVPPLQAPEQIRAYNLVVRDHPEQDNALQVDAILLNNAAFDQDFPGLVLEFSDIRGDAVAARRFTPDEYLRGDLAGATRMPRNQPIHISLELVDPGPEAVNYQAYIAE